MSVPVIIRRLAARLHVHDVRMLSPLRVGRQKIIREGEPEKAVEFAARRLRQESTTGSILVLLDSDDDLPCVLGPRLIARVRVARPDIPTAVVLAQREKEAWYIASIESLSGQHGFPVGLKAPPDPEGIRDAKGWLARARSQRYSETTDQTALASLFDLDQAEACSSFRKLVREVNSMLA